MNLAKETIDKMIELGFPNIQGKFEFPDERIKIVTRKLHFEDIWNELPGKFIYNSEEYMLFMNRELGIYYIDISHIDDCNSLDEVIFYAVFRDGITNSAALLWCDLKEKGII